MEKKNVTDLENYLAEWENDFDDEYVFIENYLAKRITSPVTKKELSNLRCSINDEDKYEYIFKLHDVFEHYDEDYICLSSICAAIKYSPLIAMHIFVEACRYSGRSIRLIDDISNMKAPDPTKLTGSKVVVGPNTIRHLNLRLPKDKQIPESGEFDAHITQHGEILLRLAP